MKKVCLAIFILALIIGVILSGGCGLGRINNLSGVRGSGNAKTETRKADGFSKVDASGAVNVEIVAQKDFSVSIEADDNLLGNIKTEVSGDTLKIYSEDKISPKTQINVKISMPEIVGLEVSGASSADVSSVKTDLIKLKASGASKIRIDGEVIRLDADASGASKIDAEELKGEDANVDASGASTATVLATEEVHLDASGASKISYVGEPKRIKQNASGASSINKK
jgi:hypothetical protein